MSLDFDLYFDLDTGNEPARATVFSGNYTHNVVPMWKKAGVMDALYNSHGKKAGEIIEVLRAGLEDMTNKPNEYSALNPPNGWGRADYA